VWGDVSRARFCRLVVRTGHTRFLRSQRRLLMLAVCPRVPRPTADLRAPTMDLRP